jgi:hypothetical protein
MDLRKFANSVGAHKYVAIIGVAAAIGFAFLAYVRVSPFGSPVFEYRKPVLWSSQITLQLTGKGFPEGRVQDVGGRRASLVALAPLYARLANTDPVRKRMRKLGPVYGGVRVSPLVDANNVALPLIQISSFTFSNVRAQTRVRRQAAAFIDAIEAQQSQNHVRPQNRVVLSVLSGPTTPGVVVPRKITLPVVVFLSMLIVTGALILTLENRRRSRRTAETPAPGDVVGPSPTTSVAPVPPSSGDGAADRVAVAPVARASQTTQVPDVTPVPGRAPVPLSRPNGTLGSAAASAETGRQADAAAQDGSTPSYPRASRRGRRR